MPKLLFQLGNTPDLSRRELFSLFPSIDFIDVLPHIIAADIPDETPDHLIAILGGTVKIFEEIETVESIEPEELENKIFTLLERQDGKITFGIAELGRDHLPPFSIRAIKSKLAAERRSVRYLEDSRQGLSAAILIHKKNITEYAIIQGQQGTTIAKTAAAQNIDEWSKIDRQKPYADRKKGMLPPKVARMMVNISLGPKVLDDLDTSITVYDPFCGSGTVLMEALLMSVKHVIGSDQDQEAVKGTQDNIAWMLPQYEITPKIHVFQHDVTRPIQQLPAHSVSHIVTEPFLGKPSPRPTQLENIFRGLERLYVGAFKQWTHVLQDNAVITIIFPRTEAELANRTRIFSLEGIIDKLEKIGYTTQSEPILYYRPQAVIQREIHTFIYKSSKK